MHEEEPLHEFPSSYALLHAEGELTLAGVRLHTNLSRPTAVKDVWSLLSRSLDYVNHSRARKRCSSRSILGPYAVKAA